MNEDFLTTAFRRLKTRFIRDDSPDDIRDSIQEAFCRLWSRKETITNRKQAEGMLTVAARNIRIDMLRRQAIHPEIDIETIKGEPLELDTTEEATELYRNIDILIKQHLTERDREILLRRDRDGWEFNEIAEYYSISEANVRVITARCRKKIRELYINKTRKHIQ